jgi:mRNA-degrading endonuclease RelE of RelBE toxin-antitoxin system
MNYELTDVGARQLKQLRGKAIYEEVCQAIFVDLEDADTLDDLPECKSLRDEGFYRIRVGGYRIGGFLDGDVLIISRIGPRPTFYNDFP